MGMPRRIYTYPRRHGLGRAQPGHHDRRLLFAVGVLLLLVNVIASLPPRRDRGRQSVGRLDAGMGDPVAAAAVQFRGHPDGRQPPSAVGGSAAEAEVRSSVLEGMVLDHGRETIGTTPLDGEPDVILKMPEDSFAPFLLTLGMIAGFVGLLLHLWWLAGAGVAVVLLAMAAWLWPRRKLGQIAAPPVTDTAHV